MTKKIAWEPHRDNITKVEYKLHQGSLINGQNVTRDVLGCVISQNLARAGHNTRTHSYGYNTRGELTADTVSTGDSQAYTWAYDPIGNRKQAWTSRDYVSKTYHTNNLNQYTEITDKSPSPFTPDHDQEGNQTLVRTNTGDWQVTYNADNRPVTFTKGSLRIENKYDYRGRRVEKATYSNNQLQKRQRFLYNGYLQIAAVDATNTATPFLLHTLYWDPTEPEVTLPLIMIRSEDGGQNWYEYTHSLNKNVSHLIDKTGSIVAHYDYDAYGNLREQTGSLADKNPIRFSSEYDDSELGLVYYNYRYYNPKDGRWINRDPISESGGNNLYGFVRNNPINYYDFLGTTEGYFGPGMIGYTAAASRDFPNSEPPRDPEQERAAKDLASMLPVIGAPISAELALDDLMNGDYGSMTLNALGIIPCIGILTKLGKWTMRLGKAKGLGNPFKGKTIEEIKQMLKKDLRRNIRTMTGIIRMRIIKQNDLFIQIPLTFIKSLPMLM